MLNYELIKQNCDKTAHDLQHLQDTLLTVKFPEILSAIAILEFVSEHMCGEQNA